ncbi:MAG TPA: ATP-binding protein, partial [Pseudobdellovibrionaceae bacterium]|nr:ATP-binding protein [Pseudobdellovibrionaceae bacterium]
TILEKELVWSALTKSAPVGIFQTDKQGSLTYMNAQGLTLSGMTVEQALGYGWLDAIHPEDRPWFEKSWFEAVKLNRYFDLQVRMAYSEPNNEVWIRAIASSIADSNGQIQGYIGIYTDVSDHVRHQKELESERVKMIESSKLATLGEMAGGIAHEINNPLAIIVGRSNIITSYLKRASVIEREKIQENIDKIEVTAQRIAKIVKGLKSFSRNAENDPLAPCSLDSIIEDSLGLCEEKLKNRSIQLHVNTGKDFMVMARPSQLSQVVLNLINNSADAIEGTSHPWIIVDVVATGTSLFLSIMDSGKGIPEEIAKKIMNPFFTTKEVGKGTGLGLSIGKGIIESHGGKLYLDRNSPHTKFIIELPLDEKIQRAA